MSTVVRFYPRTKIVYLCGRGVTTTFRASDRGQVNGTLDWLGYARVTEWERTGNYFEARTTRSNAHAEKSARCA